MSVKSILGIEKKIPMLNSGIHLTDKELLANQELTSSQILGGIEIGASEIGHYALFEKKSNGKNIIAIEIHDNDSKLQPFDWTNNGSKPIKVPALWKLPARGELDFTIVLTAHKPNLDAIQNNIQNQMKNSNNLYQAKLLQWIWDWISPKYNGGVVRNLWIFANAGNIIPLPSGQKKGLGGRIVDYYQAGPILYSLIHRERPNFKPLQFNRIGDKYLWQHCNYAAPPQIVENNSTLEIEGNHFAFFRNGVVDSETYPAISSMDVDIFLRLQFPPKSGELYVTSLLRTSGSIEEINNVYQDLKNLGGWNMIRNADLMDAFHYTIPGNKLPMSYGRRSVPNWENTNPENGRIGLLQMISEGLAPIGDPSGNISIGKKNGHIYTFNSIKLPSVLVTGISKVTGKTTTTIPLALLENKDWFWIDFTAAPLDPTSKIADQSLGNAKLVNFPDPPIYSYYSEAEVRKIWEDIRRQNELLASIWLRQLFTSWHLKGRIVGLPFVLHPVVNSNRYLDLCRIFLKKLPFYTRKWLLDKKSSHPQIVINDFSSILRIKDSSNKTEASLVHDLAEDSLFFVNHGFNHGIHPLWLLTHSSNDPNDMLGREIYRTFGIHLAGGKNNNPDYVFDLYNPSRQILEVEGLDLRITQDCLLKEVEQLTTDESKDLISRLQIKDDDIPSILTEEAGWDEETLTI